MVVLQTVTQPQIKLKYGKVFKENVVKHNDDFIDLCFCGYSSIVF